MLPPPPTSRQSSYAYALPRQSLNHTRSTSFLGSPAPGHTRKSSGLSHAGSWRKSLETDSSRDGSEGDFEDRLGMEEDLEGLSEERGLEETLEKLGFGAYHWRLLALCGFGWMSDNSALQCIAVILPRVQVHFNLTHETSGLLSACTMAGMMIGAVGWGSISDILGRALPFNATLFLTAIFGIGASFAPSFPVLCIWMFFLGSAVGGSMPTDGTLFLENLPHSKQYLLTLLSVFFSLGAVLSSVVSLIFLPGSSCREFEGCDIEGKGNDGWRRVLLVLGIFNLLCAFARWGLFRLHESPRYLVHNGREQEAVVVLRAIATYNDQEMEIHPADVQTGDAFPSTGNGSTEMLKSSEPTRDKKDSELPTPTDLGQPSVPDLLATPERPARTVYDSIGHGQPLPLRKHPIREGSAFYADTPAVTPERHNAFEASFAGELERVDSDDTRVESDVHEGLINGSASGPSKHERLVRGGVVGRKRHRTGPLAWWDSWVAQLKKLFVKQWRRTVILMWIIWGTMSFSYTMFNVWLPAVLEDRAQGEGDEAIKEALNEFVLYSIAGCPGSIVGAWMIQTKLGRRRSLAICTAATGISTFAFIAVRSQAAVIISSMVISAAATAMYAVLYGMTPETFGTAIRGTACGTSAALSRLTGVMAPVTAGFLLNISPSSPLYVSAGVLLFTAGCSLALPFERITEGGKRGSTSFAH